MPVTLKLVEKAKTSLAAGKVKPKEKEAFLADDPKGAATPPDSIGAKHRVLVVDDSPVILKAFEVKLQASGFLVTTVANAGAVASTAEETKAELIILDINFPDGGAMQWNGFTIMQWVRHFPELSNIPVILISGSCPPQCEEKCLAAGALGFFQKPVEYKALLAMILKVLGPAPVSPAAP
jgi:two-component system KDP operon response regulator KdpE